MKTQFNQNGGSKLMSKKERKRAFLKHLASDYKHVGFKDERGRRQLDFRIVCKLHNGKELREQTFYSLLDGICERYKELYGGIEYAMEFSLDDVVSIRERDYEWLLDELDVDLGNRAIYLNNCKLVDGEFVEDSGEVRFAGSCLDIDYIEVEGKSKFERFLDLAYGEDNKELLRMVIGFIISRECVDNDVVVMIMDRGYGGGGTGKSLLVKLLGEVVGVNFFNKVNGKVIMLREYNFGNNGVVCLENLSERFNFDIFYSAVKCGIYVKEKFQRMFYIPKELGTKVVVTSNCEIKNKRRGEFNRIDLFTSGRILYEYDEFKSLGKFGLEYWDNDERCRFIKFIADCWKYYKLKGFDYLKKISYEKLRY